MRGIGRERRPCAGRRPRSGARWRRRRWSCRRRPCRCRGSSAEALAGIGERVQGTSLRWRAPFNRTEGDKHLDPHPNLLRRLRARARDSGGGRRLRRRRRRPARIRRRSSTRPSTTTTKVTSGDLSLTASVSAEGEQGGSFEASLSGPFQGDARTRPRSRSSTGRSPLRVEGAGQSVDFDGGLVVTDDNAYVEYNDQAYEVGSDAFAQLREQFEAQAEAATGTDAQGTFQEQCASAIEQAGGDPAACDIDLASWLTNLTNEGTEDVGGTETVHISRRRRRRHDPHRHRRARILDSGRRRAGLRPVAAEPGLGRGHRRLDRRLLRRRRQRPAQARRQPRDRPLGDRAGGRGADRRTSRSRSRSRSTASTRSRRSRLPTDAKPISELLSDVGLDPGALGGPRRRLPAAPAAVPATRLPRVHAAGDHAGGDQRLRQPSSRARASQTKSGTGPGGLPPGPGLVSLIGSDR